MADFSWGHQVWDSAGQRGMCRHPLPGEDRVAPSLTGCPGQLDSQVAQERGAEPLDCPCTGEWNKPAAWPILGLKRKG